MPFHEIFNIPDHNCIPSGGLTGKYLAMKEAVQSALDFRSSLLDMSCSTTARHLPHSALELCHAGTATSASQLEAHLQTPQQNNSHKIRTSLSSQPIRWHNNVPDDSSPNAGTEAD
jgi:hypothetical protein